MEHLTVTDGAGERLDRWLTAHQPDRSRNRIQHDIDAGRVLVNGAARPARYRVAENDRIDYDPPPPADEELQPEAIPLQVDFEDDHLIVIDKPAGLVVHPAPGHASGTVANALLAHCGPDLVGVGGEDRWGIVHRLDAQTSGLMMAAKTAAAYDVLTEALAERRVRRQYLALTLGRFNESEGTIDRPVGRRPSDRKRMGVVPRTGRPARTHWRVLCEAEELTLLGLTLGTGRTHQIRVHLQSIGRPVLGDVDYGWTKAHTLRQFSQRMRPMLAGVWPSRQMLHAARLTLDHPIAERCRIDLRSQPPEEMIAVMDAMWGDIWREPLEKWYTLDVSLENEST